MRITGFGDYIIHFSPLNYERFAQADLMHISYTGAEENVCAALGLWGEDVSFVTRLPENTLAKRGIAVLKSFGINTSNIAFGGKRIGIYFLETGASVRSSQVIYDRDNSAFTEASPSDFDFENIISKTDIIYLTGITPLLSDSLLKCCIILCKTARCQGKQVIFDINYRPSLASADKAASVLKELSPYITTLIGNEEHIKLLLGISSSYGENQENERLLDISKKTQAILNIPNIAITVRRTISASDAMVYASFLHGDSFCVSNKKSVHIVDRVGSGDAFSAGLIYAVNHNYSVSDAVNFATASCAIKHTIPNDINYTSVEEIQSVLSDTRGDVLR